GGYIGRGCLASTQQHPADASPKASRRRGAQGVACPPPGSRGRVAAPDHRFDRRVAGSLFGRHRRRAMKRVVPSALIVLLLLASTGCVTPETLGTMQGFTADDLLRAPS